MTKAGRDALRAAHNEGFVTGEMKTEGYAFALLEWRNRAIQLVNSEETIDLCSAYIKTGLDTHPRFFEQMMAICKEFGLPDEVDKLHTALTKAIGVGELEQSRMGREENEQCR